MSTQFLSVACLVVHSVLIFILFRLSRAIVQIENDPSYPQTNAPTIKYHRYGEGRELSLLIITNLDLKKKTST